MNDQQVREIAEAAFKAHFGDIDVCRINIRHGFDHEDDPVVDLTLIYDGKYEQLNANGLLDVRLDINHKVWRDAEELPRLAARPLYPQVRNRAAGPGDGVFRPGPVQSIAGRRVREHPNFGERPLTQERNEWAR